MSAADEIMGEICAFADETLSASPETAFAVVIWVKGRADNAQAVAVGNHPDSKGEVALALKTASAALATTEGAG